jgi:hypothetical protein
MTAHRMIQYVKSFVRYYAVSQAMEIESRFDAAQSLSRVLDLDRRGEIRIWQEKNHSLMAVGAQWGKSNILHVFRGRLEDRAGHVVLKGEVGIDRGIRIVLGVFCFVIFILFPFRRVFFLSGIHVSADVEYAVGALGFMGLLIVLYLFGRNDSGKIIRNLEHALNDKHCA